MFDFRQYRIQLRLQFDPGLFVIEDGIDNGDCLSLVNVFEQFDGHGFKFGRAVDRNTNHGAASHADNFETLRAAGKKSDYARHRP
jgi:hypothetical protein